VNWHWFERPSGTDDADTRIRFNDVVFGIVIAKIFNEAAVIETLPWPVRTHLLLAFVVTLGSYIGYRKSLKRSKYTVAFFNLPLFQFILGLGMIYFYYRLSATPDVSVTPGGTAKPPVNVNPGFDAITVFFVFVLYVVWDLVSLLMRKKYSEIKFSVSRTIVTGAFLLLSAIVLLFANSELLPRDSVIAVIVVDLLLVAIALAYRWVKDGLYNSSP